jgi:hypothetical protein
LPPHYNLIASPSAAQEAVDVSQRGCCSPSIRVCGHPRLTTITVALSQILPPSGRGEVIIGGKDGNSELYP